MVTLEKEKPVTSEHARLVARKRNREHTKAKSYLIYPATRCGSVKSRHKGRKSASAQLRTTTPEKAEAAVLSFLRENRGKNAFGNPSNWVTKEEIAHKANIRTHLIEAVFQKLNLAGLLRKETRAFAHDTNRNPMFYARESGWAGNRYHLTEPGIAKLAR